jgi:DNA-binding transcriptional LysR family regulator
MWDNTHAGANYVVNHALPRSGISAARTSCQQEHPGVGARLGDVVPDVLKGLHRARPRLVLAVISGDWDALRERLQRGEIDVVISTEPVGVIDEDIVVEPLCEERHVVLAARDHPLVGTPPTPRQLHRASWVGIDRLPRAEADLRRYFEAARLKPPIPRVRTEVTAFAAAWVARTDHLCVLPGRAVTSAVRGGGVTTLEVRLSDPPWSLVAAYRRRAIRTPGMVAFLDGLRAALREPAVRP